jgi:xylulose-5-phosphate/fructose-6-phosphate phosphoketolase
MGKLKQDRWLPRGILNKFLNPARDGAVLPILHLNGYKIANPTLLSRISEEELTKLFEGYGYAPHYVEGCEPDVVHPRMAAVLERCLADIKAIQHEWRSSADHSQLKRPRWPRDYYADTQRSGRVPQK